MPGPSPSFVEANMRSRSPSPESDWPRLGAPGRRSAQPDIPRRMQPSLAPTADVRPAWLQPQQSSGSEPIVQPDTDLPHRTFDLAAEYPDGVQSDYARAYVIAADIVDYVREQLSYGSANQKWNDKNAETSQNERQANPSSAPIHEALMRTQFIDHYSGRYLPESKMRRFALSQTHRSEEQRDLARRIRHAFMWSETPEPDDAPQAGAQRADTHSDFVALAQEVLQYKPRLLAQTAYVVRAGNDNHMAALAYTGARYRFDSSYVVQLMQMPGHTFCRIGMPAWPEERWWVIDPWPRDAYPVRFEHHLGYGCSELLVSKPGKGAPDSDEKEQRYAALNSLMAEGLRDFREKTWPDVKKPTLTMHNCLYPTKDSISWLYTVLVRQPDVELTPRYERISRRHEEARIVVAGIIKDVKAKLKYGSKNQAWNFDSDPAGGPQSASQSQKRLAEVSMRLNFLREPPAGHLSDEEMRRFADADNGNATYRIDVAGKIRRLLSCEPAGSEQAADDQKALEKLREEVLVGKPRLLAYAALGAEVGNCGEFACVSYMLARQRFGPEYMVHFATTAIPEHQFCVVGMKDWPLSDWWVIDAWPRDAYPVLAKHYFAHENIRLGDGKPGKGVPHSPEKEQRYVRFRDDVARRFEEYRQSRATNSANTKSLAQALPNMYNCLYPTADPVKWRYRL